MNKTNKQSWKDFDIAYLCENQKLKAKKELWAKYQEEKRAKLYDALELLRDNKRYLKLTDKADNELMMKMWAISHNKEFI